MPTKRSGRLDASDAAARRQDRATVCEIRMPLYDRHRGRSPDSLVAGPGGAGQAKRGSVGRANRDGTTHGGSGNPGESGRNAISLCSPTPCDNMPSPSCEWHLPIRRFQPQSGAAMPVQMRSGGPKQAQRDAERHLLFVVKEGGGRWVPSSVLAPRPHLRGGSNGPRRCCRSHRTKRGRNPLVFRRQRPDPESR
ncbi:MAG: hypothetical protein RIS70_2950 [Planctomycetota bacterium]|jgi:hypothetical protein